MTAKSVDNSLMDANSGYETEVVLPSLPALALLPGQQRDQIKSQQATLKEQIEQLRILQSKQEQLEGQQRNNHGQVDLTVSDKNVEQIEAIISTSHEGDPGLVQLSLKLLIRRGEVTS